jgi:hypothetical protein
MNKRADRRIAMKSSVTEVAAGVYHISTFHPGIGIQLNQFLLDDDEPFLMHTALKKMFPITLEGVSSVLDRRRSDGSGSATSNRTNAER